MRVVQRGGILRVLPTHATRERQTIYTIPRQTKLGRSPRSLACGMADIVNDDLVGCDFEDNQILPNRERSQEWITGFMANPWLFANKGDDVFNPTDELFDSKRIMGRNVLENL